MAAEGGAIRSLLAVFGFDVDASELKKGEKTVEGFVGKIEKFASGLVGAFAGKAIFEFAEANVEAMSEIEKASSRLGITTDEFQMLSYAAKQADISTEEFTASMKKFQLAQVSAAEGSEKTAKAFAFLGVSTKDQNGNLKETDQLMFEVAEGFTKVKDPAKRADIAVKLFGKTGGALIPLLQKGSAGIEALSAEFKELGGGYTQDAIDKAGEFETSQKKLNTSFVAIKSSISSTLLPVITKLMDLLKIASVWFNTLTKDSNIWAVALGLLSAVALKFAVSLIIASAPLIAMGLLFLGLAIIIEDLIGLFTGKDSLIGEWIDKAFGKGSSTTLVNELKDAWAGVVSWIKEAWDMAKEFWKAMEPVRDFMGSTVGEAFKGLKNIGEELGDALGGAKVDAVMRSQYGTSAEGGAGGYTSSGFVPSMAPSINGGGNSSSSISNSVVVHAAPGMSEEQLSEKMVAKLDEHSKNKNRAAAATFQRKTAQ